MPLTEELGTAGECGLILLAAAGLLGLSACTEYGYVKPGVTEEVYVQDSQDCAEIARHQAFRDHSVFESRARFGRSFRYDRRRFSTFDSFGVSSSELEFRYRRLCMVSRGYELAPLDDQGEDEESSGGAEDAQGG
jgi:hypothetical protein